MITTKNLKFYKCEPTPNAPFFTCNSCGLKVRMNDQCYMADFPIDEESHVSFFICSIRCLADFHSVGLSEAASNLITDTIKRAARIHFGGTTPAYKNFITRLNLDE